MILRYLQLFLCFSVSEMKPSILLPSDSDVVPTSLLTKYSSSSDQSELLSLKDPFYILGTQSYNIYISENGVIGVNATCSHYMSEVFPPTKYCSDFPVFSPYWADVDLSSGSGYLSYYTVNSSDSGQNILLNSVIPAFKSINPNYTADSAVVITWFNVGFASFVSDTPTNSFQVVIATNSITRQSAAMYNYKQLSWTGGVYTGSNMWTGLNGTVMPQMGFASGDPSHYVVLDGSGTENAVDNANKLSSNSPRSESPKLGRWVLTLDDLTVHHVSGITVEDAYSAPSVCFLGGDPHVITFDSSYLKTNEFWNPQLEPGAGPALLAAPCKYDGSMGPYHWSVWFQTFRKSPNDTFTLVNRIYVKFQTAYTVNTFIIDGSISLYSTDTDMKNQIITLNQTLMGYPAAPVYLYTQLASGQPYVCCEMDGNQDVTVTLAHGALTIAYEGALESQMRLSVLLQNMLLEPIYLYIPPTGTWFYKCNMAGLCGNMNGLQDEMVYDNGTAHYWCFDDANYCQVSTKCSGVGAMVYADSSCENNCWSRKDLFDNIGVFRSGNGICSTVNPGNIPSTECGYSGVGGHKHIPYTDFSLNDPVIDVPGCNDAVQQACNPLVDQMGPLAPFIRAGTITCATSYATCVSDICRSVPVDPMEAACQYFLNAVNLVKLNDISLQSTEWRSSEFCSMNCSTNMHHDICGDACPTTCTDRTSAANCKSACIEGCFCDDNLVLKEDNCVPVSECGCTDDDGYFHMANSSWIVKNCQQSCMCNGDSNIICESIQSCGDHAICSLPDSNSNDTVKCYCEKGYSQIDGMFVPLLVRTEILISDSCEWDPCSSQPCFNHGTCLNGASTYACNCPPQFTGIQCETVVDVCSSTPCLNNGSCIDINGGFNCNCVDGFLGPLCQFVNDQCGDVDCGNGVCISGPGGYRCECKDWFTGAHCDSRVDHCSSKPCLYGSECYYSEYTPYTCNCTSGSYGLNCENIVNHCTDTSCLNGGSCVPVFDGFQCICPSEYSGRHCKNVITTSTASASSSPSTSSTMLPSTATTETLSICTGSSFSCVNKSNGDYRDPMCQCATYYIMCSNDVKYIMPCPSDLVYDGELCTYARNVPGCGDM